MRTQHLRSAVALVALLGLPACSRTPAADPALVATWMHSLYGAIRVERLSPPVASRLLVYASSALYAGLAESGTKLPSLAGVLNGFPQLPAPDPAARGKLDGTLVAVAAERLVLDSLLREGLPTTRAAMGRLADSLAAARAAFGVSDATRAASNAYGQQIGVGLVRWSRSDGFDSTRGRAYVPPVGVGLWTNDAPANTYAAQSLSGATDFVALDNPANALRSNNASDRGMILNHPKSATRTLPAVNMAGTSEPYWGQVRPFALHRWDECTLADPPAYSADTASPVYREAYRVAVTRHAKSTQPGDSILTPEQRAIAFYWADNAGESGTPPGHWIAIASQMVSERHLSAADAARLMVMTSVAQADAFIAAWGYKYRYNRLRPRAYIRGLIDPTWEPLIPTPPFPEYPSAHSTQSAAAAGVLTHEIGNVAFEDSTGISIGNPVRRFDSFTSAAHEAGASRIYGGIHFPSGNMGGRALGECIGGAVLTRFGVHPSTS
jgi:membrane-associated phospholipid phosphatase